MSAKSQLDKLCTIHFATNNNSCNKFHSMNQRKRVPYIMHVHVFWNPQWRTHLNAHYFKETLHRPYTALNTYMYSCTYITCNTHALVHVLCKNLSRKNRSRPRQGHDMAALICRFSLQSEIGTKCCHNWKKLLWSVSENAVSGDHQVTSFLPP